MKRYLIITLGLTIILSSCGGKNANQNKGSQIKKVNTIQLPLRDITTHKTYTARIEGVINSEARPKIAGYITDVLVDEGQRVHKGQVLFKLETVALNEEAVAAQANIHAAQVQVDQLIPLVEKNIVSENQLATAEARLSQAKATYQSIQANIGYATVKSPVDGYVGQIRIRKGNLVSPNDPQPLTTVSDINEVYAYFSMNEKEYLDFLMESEGETREEKIKNLPEVTLIMANGHAYPNKGKIQTINSQIDRRTGTIDFRAVFNNESRFLTNGSTGKIQVPSIYKDVIVVPQNSTYSQQDKTYVMKVQKSDSGTFVVTKPFEILDEIRNFYIVAEGVEEGEEIVAAGVGQLSSGERIEPVLHEFDSIIKPEKVVYEK